jgi:6-phosphofructokinase 1
MRIGLITRDNAGINACIRAIVRSADYYGIDIVGFSRGYKGLIEDDSTILTTRSVSGIINLGGSILKSARCPEFKTEEGLKKAYQTYKNHRLSGLIVIGGNGSLSGAHDFSERFGIPLVGIPATIDNDVNGVEMTLGADTAINVALDALDKLRDTAHSMERVFVVEVMGRDSGYLAERVALAAGCEDVVIPELPFDVKSMCTKIMDGHDKGKLSWIVIVAEGKARAYDVAEAIREQTGLETREMVLGHIQRGGMPTAYDRILASRMGVGAVKAFKEGKKGVMVAVRDTKVEYLPLEMVRKPKPNDAEATLELMKLLS